MEQAIFLLKAQRRNALADVAQSDQRLVELDESKVEEGLARERRLRRVADMTAALNALGVTDEVLAKEDEERAARRPTLVEHLAETTRVPA